ASGRRYLEIPVRQERVDRVELLADDPDVRVVMMSPGATEMQVQRAPTADPPTEGRRREDADDGLDPERLPGPELRWRHEPDAPTQKRGRHRRMPRCVER